ncbi:MAG: hypothetical protein L6406_03860, partial [Desulfobacterales bacterium]|nr:hypothetical protein [Desulfobacterales bacterium]
LQGALILENSRDLVKPVCQIRTSWTGFSTCKAEMRMSKNVIVQPGYFKFLKPALIGMEEFCQKKVNLFS